MSDDVRLATGLRSHRKTKRLKRLAGKAGCWSLVCLFMWAGEERWTGDLAGLSDADIEEEADWDGEPGALIAALLEVKFLVGPEGKRRIHDWHEHNPYAAGKGERIANGRKGANARWGKKTDAGCNAGAMPPASDPHGGRTEPQCPLPNPTEVTTTSESSQSALRIGTEAGRACRLMREAGIGIGLNPSHVDLLAALDEGVTPEVLRDCAREAVELRKRNPFAYAIAIARGRRAEGAREVATGPPRPVGKGKTAQAIEKLQGMKNGLADAGNHDGVPKAALPRPGSPASG